MNEAEKKLREAWAKASAADRACVADWEPYEPPRELGSAVRAFCESEPSAPAVVEPEALRRVREAWKKLPVTDRAADLDNWRKRHVGLSPEYHALCYALADLLESAPVEGGEDLRAKLAAAEKERDEAKREAEAMRDLATRNANELNAALKERNEARRDLECARASYQMQAADLTRALESEKKAHNEALKSASRPDEYTRAAVAAMEKWCAPAFDGKGFTVEADAFHALWNARQRGEPSAPVSTPPPARALETWVSEDRDGGMVFGYESAPDAFRSGALRAHKVALPVIETVERGQ